MSTSKLTACGQRWVNDLANYRFEIRYKPGRNNQVADCLSRNPLNIEDYTKGCTEEITVAEAEAIKEGVRVPAEEQEVIANIVNTTRDKSFDEASITSAKTIDLKRYQEEDPSISEVIMAIKSNSRPTKKERKGKDPDTVFLLHNQKKAKNQ